jgi:hypothetical protein
MKHLPGLLAESTDFLLQLANLICGFHGLPLSKYLHYYYSKEFMRVETGGPG